MTTPMELTEARRRFEKLLVLAGYSMTGKWTEKYHLAESGVSSMALTNIPEVRGVLWFEDGHWQAMLAIRVGEDGEFPLTGGRILRRENQFWQLTLKSMPLMTKRIVDVLAQIRRWDTSPTESLGDKAMIRLALSYLRNGKPKKAGSILLGALRGEISSATVSESLSIVQMRWAKSREERFRSALIWSSTFK